VTGEMFRAPSPPAYAPLPEADAQRIVDAAFEILRDVGAQFDPEPEVLDLFAKARCDVSPAGVVKFEAEVVREALHGMGRQVTLWNREGDSCIEIREGNTCFFPGMTAIKVLDGALGEARTSGREDLVTIARIADALPELDGVCLPCKIVEHSDVHGEMEEFAALVSSTSKPLEFLCESAAGLDAAIEMAAAIRGGADRLAKQPYFLHIITPLPLCYAKCHTDQILRAVRSGVPVGLGTVNIGGASTPISIAGNIAHALATDLAGMLLGQLAMPGSFCVGSSDVGFIDPATGSMGGFSQEWLAEQAVNQIRRGLGIPSLTSIAGSNDSRVFDAAAVADLTASMLIAFHSRPALCGYLGMIDGGLTFSLHALLFCHELASMLRSLWRGIRVDDEMLALDLVREVGPRGNYLAQRHTAKHCRTELWRPRYLAAAGFTGSPERDLVARIDAHLAEILEAHRCVPLAEPLRGELRAILERRGASAQGC
jgi:trimethylamine:corrinoid methyltransferase-like protein